MVEETGDLFPQQVYLFLQQGVPVLPAVAHLFFQQAHLLYHTGFQPYFYMYI